ncbi:Uncharacterised protein [Halioglobus japonicus]|nr:Uncharacterised protein [Halioglobus japonicus]
MEFVVNADLGFTRPEEVVDGNDARGLKRAVTRPVDEEFSRQFEFRRCQVRDWSAPGQPRLNFRKMGFESINLSHSDSLQTLLAQIREAGDISAEQARHLRRLLTGNVYPLSGGSCLKVLQVAPEGLIMRQGGPNGLKVDPDVEIGEMNGHDAALAIHGDQDVRGTPLKQMMRGFAPWMFRHQTPDGSNRLSPLVLVNLWVPLQQVTRPLTLMDRRTLKPREHQLRYALPTDEFLDRTEDMSQNDIWAFLHDDAQQWYFHSHMAHDQAYVFDTLGEPHGSFILPGEELAEHCYLQLKFLREKLAAGEVVERPARAAVDLSHVATEPLRQAIESMTKLVASAPVDKIGQPVVDVWLARAAEAMDSVVRKSLEMRVVALLLPNIWPFNRSVNR